MNNELKEVLLDMTGEIFKVIRLLMEENKKLETRIKELEDRLKF